jgi:hypothetical protein
MARDGIAPAEIFRDRGRALPTNRLLWLSASDRALSLRGSDCRNLRSVRRLTPAIYGQATRVRFQDGQNGVLNGGRNGWPSRYDLADVEPSTEFVCVYLCADLLKCLSLSTYATGSNPVSRTRLHDDKA